MENAVQAIDLKLEKKERRALNKQAVRSFSRIFFALFVYILLASAVIVVGQTALIFILGADEAATVWENPYILWGSQVVSMYIVALPVFLKMIKKLPKKEFTKSRMKIGEFFGTFFVCEAAMIIGNIISTYICDYISTLLGYEITNATSDLIMKSPVFLVIAVAVVIGPIVEEVIFRKAIIDRLGMYGERYAVATSAIAFGIFHGNLNQLIYATALGFILGWVYTRTGRIRTSCMLHIFVNFMGTVPAILLYNNLELIENLALDNADEIMGLIPEVIPAIILVLTQYLFALLGIIVFFNRKSNGKMSLGKECDISLSFPRKIRCSVLNAGAILFVALCLAEILVSLMAI